MILLKRWYYIQNCWNENKLLNREKNILELLKYLCNVTFIKKWTLKLLQGLSFHVKTCHLQVIKLWKFITYVQYNDNNQFVDKLSFYNLFKISFSWNSSMLTLFVCNKKLSDLTQSLKFFLKRCPDTSSKIHIIIKVFGLIKYFLSN